MESHKTNYLILQETQQFFLETRFIQLFRHELAQTASQTVVELELALIWTAIVALDPGLSDGNSRLNANNDNFISVADGIDLRARHIHALPQSNKAMPRKRENQRYFLGLGYLSRAFFGICSSKKTRVGILSSSQNYKM